MTDVHVVRHDNARIYKDQLDQYFRARYEVCVRERGWARLARPDGRDIDQFDTADAVHFLAINAGQVVGGIRLNPTTGPTLLNSVFPQLSAAPLRGSPEVFEKSRLWVRKDKRGRASRPRIESVLMAACVEFGLAVGLRAVRSVCEPFRVERNRNLGWAPRLLGPPVEIEGLPCVAIEKNISEAVWIRICVQEGVPGATLRWHGTPRPRYRLPELLSAVA